MFIHNKINLTQLQSNNWLLTSTATNNFYCSIHIPIHLNMKSFAHPVSELIKLNSLSKLWDKYKNFLDFCLNIIIFVYVTN